MHFLFDPPSAESYSGYPIDDHFDVELANRLAELESYNKHLYRPNTYLHKWWARRCGSTFRTLLKHLVENRDQRDYYAAGGLTGKIVLDPMMGGGTTLHEAIRLGANVVGADIDPIPIVQVRASLSAVELHDLQTHFDAFFDSIRESLRDYFETECPKCGNKAEALYTLSGLRKECDCGEVVQIDQYELRHEGKKTYRICPQCWSISDIPCDCSGDAMNRA